MKQFLAGLGLGIAALVTMACVATPPAEAPDDTSTELHHPTYTLVPCTEEDAEYNCYWDASEMGNGEGSDFIVFNGQVYRP